MKRKGLNSSRTRTRDERLQEKLADRKPREKKVKVYNPGALPVYVPEPMSMATIAKWHLANLADLARKPEFAQGRSIDEVWIGLKRLMSKMGYSLPDEIPEPPGTFTSMQLKIFCERIQPLDDLMEIEE